MDLLSDCLAEIVRLGGREAGELLRDLHVLLLVDADAVRGAGQRLEPRVDERDRLLPRLAARVDGDVRHRPGTVERHERDQVLELRRLHLAQRLAHARTTRTGRRPLSRRAGACSYVGSSSSGMVVMSSPSPMIRTAASITSRLRRPRKSIFSRPSASTSPIANCVTTSWSSALLLERDDVRERPVGDDDPGGVDRVLAHEPLERLREVDDLADERVGVVRRAQLLPRLERLVEVHLRPLGDELGDLVDGAVRDIEHAAGVTDRRARHHRPERDDLRHAVAPVLVGRVVDHAVAARDGEVDVDVRHRLPARVEHALEQEVVLDRIDLRDPEAVRDERPCGRSAPRPDADAVARGRTR